LKFYIRISSQSPVCFVVHNNIAGYIKEKLTDKVFIDTVEQIELMMI